MKLLLVLGFILVSRITAFDIIRESFKIVNHTADPCEDFYRHVCPAQRGIKFLIEDVYAEKLLSLKAKSADAPWNNLSIDKVLKRTLYAELPSEPLTFIKNFYQSQCEDSNVSITERETFLKKVEQAAYGSVTVDCKFDLCLTPLARDNNCSRSAHILETRLSNVDVIKFARFDLFELIWNMIVQRTKENLYGINAILNGEIENSIPKMKNLIQKIVDKLSDLIKNTPWAKNSEAVDAILYEAREVHLFDNLGKSLSDSLNFLFRFEQTYLKCLLETKNTTDYETFCMLVSTYIVEKQFKRSYYFTYFNAFNSHPRVAFSYLLYDMLENIEEPAAMLGSVGFVAGHEVSHTMIENSENPRLIPYFSNDSMQCIQNQYRKTCEDFKEKSCSVSDRQIDENGSDILGLRLAYKLFEDVYGADVEKEYIHVENKTITVQQLFFYSTAFSFCSGRLGEQIPGDPHSTANIRVNAVMQIPAFREAFQCSSESKMVQSFVDECVIFGEDAPEMI